MSVARSLRDLSQWLQRQNLSLPWYSNERYSSVPTNGASKNRYNFFRANRVCVIAIPAVIVLFIFFAFADPRVPLYKPAAVDEYAPCEHPVLRLALESQTAFNATVKHQSKSLREAVAEYKRRYNMPPPPNFDKWYEFAVARGTPLIDEYDTIYHSLLPFWALKPSVVRSRVRENLGYPNGLMGISVRHGEPIHLGDGQGDFQRDATLEMLSKFSEWLPDMDLSFNANDEPRVIIPHDELNRMVTVGQEAQSRTNLHKAEWMDKFSQIPNELVEPIEPTTRTRFSEIDRQETWLISRLSCPVDSPARSLDGDAPDNATGYALGPLGFVYNHTAFGDICQTPSLRHRLGAFDRPNSCRITPELSPVFSMSKLASTQDIPYPSPWYYGDQTVYDDALSVPWDEKRPQLYWRGSTTSGWSENGAWRNQLRQQVITKLNNLNNTTQIFKEADTPSTCKGGKGWERTDVAAVDYQEFFNAKFTEVKQCAEEDCAEQNAFFKVAHFEGQNEAWRYRYLLDMDGNAYSGRFYAFLRSKSLPVKLSYFQEWHADTVIPWVHYVPVSLETNEYTELVRYFEHDPEGQGLARQMAMAGNAWSKAALSKANMEVYMFRLLLEYGRVVDDNREMLGYH